MAWYGETIVSHPPAVVSHCCVRWSSRALFFQAIGGADIHRARGTRVTCVSQSPGMNVGHRPFGKNIHRSEKSQFWRRKIITNHVDIIRISTNPLPFSLSTITEQGLSILQYLWPLIPCSNNNNNKNKQTCVNLAHNLKSNHEHQLHLAVTNTNYHSPLNHIKIY